ncbi:MAG: hypothetical protein AABX29_02855 [Nanoarchaeota archaeon]
MTNSLINLVNNIQLNGGAVQSGDRYKARNYPLKQENRGYEGRDDCDCNPGDCSDCICMDCNDCND